jgi:kynurenine formamidase
VTRVAPFGFTNVVFLSHVIDDNTPVFPGDPPFEIHPATIERNGYYLQSLVAGEQAGTHWAALLLQDHRIHLENLAGLSEMPPTGGWIITGGIRIRAGSGSPATAFGLIP